MMKRLFLTMVVFMMLTGSVLAADPVTLKWGTFEPPVGWSVTNIWNPWISELNKIGEGVLQHKMYSGGTLGRNPMTYLKLVTDGVMDVGQILNPYMPGRFIDDVVCSFPYLAEGSLKPTVAMSRLYERGLLRGYEGLHPLAITSTNQVSLHTNFPVTSPTDLKGKKIRAAGKIQFEFLKALGATPVPIPITKAAESISRGVIQGAMTEPLAITTYRIADVAKYHAIVPLGCVIIMQTMTEKKYHSLSADARALLDKYAGIPLARRWGEINNVHNKEIIEKWKKDPKHIVFIPNAEQTKEWKKLTAPVLEAWLKESPKNVALLKAYKEELAKAK